MQPGPAGDSSRPRRPARPTVDRNLQLVERFRAQAQARKVTPTQLAFAWVLAKGKYIVPLVGARSRERLAEALGALDIALSAADVSEIEEAVPPEAVEGGIYAGFLQQIIQRERSQ
jgi:aryl-alcohol dehydrogenase-like predicted oxidoreductase